jgi:hypothetical protein
MYIKRSAALLQPDQSILKKDLRAPYWEGRTRNVN